MTVYVLTCGGSDLRLKPDFRYLWVAEYQVASRWVAAAHRRPPEYRGFFLKAAADLSTSLTHIPLALKGRPLLFVGELYASGSDAVTLMGPRWPAPWDGYG